MELKMKAEPRVSHYIPCKGTLDILQSSPSWPTAIHSLINTISSSVLQIPITPFSYYYYSIDFTKVFIYSENCYNWVSMMNLLRARAWNLTELGLYSRYSPDISYKNDLTSQNFICKIVNHISLPNRAAWKINDYAECLLCMPWLNKM